MIVILHVWLMFYVQNIYNLRTLNDMCAHALSRALREDFFFGEA